MKHLILGLSLLMTLSACKIDHNYQLKKDLNRSFPELLDEFQIPGSAVAIIEAGKIEFQKGYGFENPEHGKNFGSETRIPSNKLEELLTAWTVLKLVEEGKLDLDTPISQLLPNVEFKDEASQYVLLQHCLSHSSSLYLPNTEEELGSIRLTSNILKGDSDTTLSIPSKEEPGKNYLRSFVNYALIQRIVEVTTGSAFEEALQSMILEPMGLQQTGYTTLEEIASSWNEEGKANKKSGEGTYVFSTSLNDLSKLVLASIQPDKILKPSTVDTMQVPFPGTDGQFGMGYATFLFNINLPHAGFYEALGGYHSLVVIDQEFDHALILLSNGANGDILAHRALCKWATFHQGHCPRNIRYLSPFRSIQKPYANGGAEEATKQLEILKKYYSNLYAFYPDEIAAYAETAIENQDDPNRIIDFLLINKAEYPEHDPTYDLLAQVYLSQGEKEKAVNTYSQAYYLNPERTYILDTLERMGVSLDEPQLVEVTFVVESKTVPDEDTVYISGNSPLLGEWQSRRVPLAQTGEYEWKITIRFYQNSRLEYKFNRGNWDTEAYSRWRSQMSNKELRVVNDTTVVLEVKHWADIRD